MGHFTTDTVASVLGNRNECADVTKTPSGKQNMGE
jgi:hypothetical protein